MQLELPELGLLISTRKQALDVPVDGTRVDLLPLNEAQQVEIAWALRGDAGERILDQAWRTAGVRELVTIPLYLTSLLALPEGMPFPTTKEEVIRRFVAVHEEDNRRAEELSQVTRGLHRRFLEDLAATATRATNTTIMEALARKSVSETGEALVVEGQITNKPQPDVVLEALVSHHVLVRAGDPPGYSFQHQQFEEWYASHPIERLILESVGAETLREALKADILNQPRWEEAILFACERLARGSPQQQEACGTAILAAFVVDPMLAAEMIARATDAVWTRVGSTVQEAIRRWHMPGKVDRALRFMTASGRPEFLDQVWPLITHENDQVSLAALRAANRFQTSLLGSNAAKRIAALSPKIRKNVLHEIASNSGMDGLDLAASVAKDDPDPEVKATVVDAFAFRRADRHVVEVLRGADQEVFDLVARRGLVDNVTDEQVKTALDAARERRHEKGISAYDQLHAIVYARDGADHSEELTGIVAEMEIDKGQDAKVGLLYEARTRYSRAVADGLLQRVRAGRPLFYGADDILAIAGLALEDDELIGIALTDSGRNDDRAEAAASALGPQAVGRMIEALFEVKKRIRDGNDRYDPAAGDRYHELLNRIGHTPGASLSAAVRMRSGQASNEERAEFAELIARHPSDESDRGRPFDADVLAAIAALAEDWGNRLLASTVATRVELASIATLATKSPSTSLLPLLKRLLDEDLHQWRAFKEQARANHYRQGTATNEARISWMLRYQRAFHAISGPETAALMRAYLPDEDFGESAAFVLVAQWRTANEPSNEKRLFGGVDFSHVEEKRAERAADPTATSIEAEAIFSVIETLVADTATDNQRKHAVALGVIAARLPHGGRDATIQRILALAPRRSRAALLQNLILSGETIDIDVVRNGIAELLEEGKTQPWILSQGDGYELKEWLRLLPFADRPTDTLTIIGGLPDQQRSPFFLEEMVAAFGAAPSKDAENVLFPLAEDDPRFYADHAWRDAAMRRGDMSTARRIVDLAAKGAFEGKGIDRWYIARQIGNLIGENPELRAYVYNLLRLGPTSSGLALLAGAVAEEPDVEGLLLLVEIENEHKPSFISWRTIEKVVTEHVPAENWKGAYNIVPIPAVELRQKLLTMTTDGGPTDAAARCLIKIDEIRDEYGTPELEPRHPDLTSGKVWPIMTRVPDV